VVARGRILASRRQLLHLALIGLAASAAPRRALGQAPGGEARLGDAHVHLFNLADLPARGFFRHVVIGAERARTGVLPALLDIIEKLRPMVVTASAELDALIQGRDPEPVTSLQIYTRVEALVREGAARSSIGSPSALKAIKLWSRPLELADSYGLLAYLLRLVERIAPHFDKTGPELLGVRTPPDQDLIFGGTSDPVRSKAFDRLLRSGKAKRGPCPEAPTDSSEMSLDLLREQLVWVHLMVQPRRILIEQYRSAIGQGELRPVTVANMLVDYDRWLEDRPSTGSSHDEQIAFWTALSRHPKASKGLDIRTFAGFDPLRHAEERLSGGPTHLDKLLGYQRSAADRSAPRVIHGFKLYPPMGFAPSGNVPWMFEGNSAALEPVRARWAARFPDRRLHEELNQSLWEFFSHCSRQRIPILAHAYHSNEAGLCFGSRASPTGWKAVVKCHPGLRICLGHFTDANDFLRGLQLSDAGRGLPPEIWAWTGTRELMEANGKGGAEVYADISYMSELLLARKGKGRDLARRFFAGLLDFCREYDLGCRHFMFGTDWVLLAREPGNRNYVKTVRDAMSETLWPDEWQENLLHANLQRFLEPRSPVAGNCPAPIRT
jgi:hypothetical protein